MFSRLISLLRTGRPAGATSSAACDRHRFRPQLETLETRDAPAVVTGNYFPTPATGGAENFVIGLDSQVYYQRFQSNGAPLDTSYHLLAPGAVKSIVTMTTSTSFLQVVLAIGLDDQVYGVALQKDGTPTLGLNYSLMAGGQVLSIATLSNFFTDTGYFVKGLDSQIYSEKILPSGKPDPTKNYTLVAPGQVKSFDLASAGGSDEVFAIGLDNQVYSSVVGGSTGAYTLTRPGAIKSFSVSEVLSSGQYAPQLYVIGLDSRVYYQQFSASGASGSLYTLLAPDLYAQSLSATISNSNVPVLLIQGLDRQAYSVNFTGIFNSAATPITLIAPGQTASIDLGSNLMGQTPEAFVVGLDGQVYYMAFVNSPTRPATFGYTLAAAGQIK